MSPRTPNAPNGNESELLDRRRMIVGTGAALAVALIPGCREKVQKQTKRKQIDSSTQPNVVSFLKRTRTYKPKECKEVKTNEEPKKTEVTKEAKEVKMNAVMIDGKEVKIGDIKPLGQDSAFINHARIMQYPMSDETRGIINQMNASEGFAQVENYPKDAPFMARGTAAKLYELAKKYAAMEGHKLAAFSAHRSYAKHRELMDKNKDGSDMEIATVGDSQFVRGGALSVLLFREGNKEPLTPTRAKPGRGTKADIHRLYKYMQLAGFVNFSGQPEHYEVGSEEWAKIMVQAGLPEAKNKLYQPVDKPTAKATQ